MKNNFKVGEIVIYQNGDRFELGEIKRVCEDGSYFVYYHMGDTAAGTPADCLHKITNLYAFKIEREKYNFCSFDNKEK